MAEEIQTQKNTVATVGMRFSIIGLIALISIVLCRLWLPLLFVWFVLWIVGLFYKPRKRARIAVCIPLIVFIALICTACYFWKSVKTPANEFMDWAKPQLEQLESEDFDEDRFENLLQTEINNITNNTSDNERKDLIETSTGSNLLEKGSYLFFSIVRQSMETALEKYNNGDLPKINEEDDDNIIDVDIDVEDKNDEDAEDDIEEEITIEQPKTQNNETFSQSEKNDIEEILDILE